MRHTNGPITVAFIGAPESSAATLYGFFDALASVRRDWTCWPPACRRCNTCITSGWKRPSTCWSRADAPVEAVASDVGYSDASFFGRLFRRKVGTTPAQYRLRFGRLSRELRGFAR